MAELPKILFKWEYKRVWGRGVTEEFLNQFGEQGWELIMVQEDGTVIFKRPKLEAAYLDADEVEEAIKRILVRD